LKFEYWHFENYLRFGICYLVLYRMPDIYVSPKNEEPVVKETPQKNSTVSPLEAETISTDSIHHPLRNKRNILLKMRNKSSVGNSLSSFEAYPKNTRFETQEDTEEIIFVLRKHFITNFVWIMIALFMLVFPFFFPFVFSELIKIQIPLNFQIMGYLLWYSITISSIFMNFLIWYFNVYIVTDERVVDVDFYNLTVKQIASAPMEHIQDVTIQTGGIIRTIFDFAWIRIQTAGAEDYITFEDVPHPDIVARKILEVAELNRNEQRL